MENSKQLSFLEQQALETTGKLDEILGVLVSQPDDLTVAEAIRSLTEEMRLIREILTEGLGIWATR